MIYDCVAFTTYINFVITVLQLCKWLLSNYGTIDSFVQYWIIFQTCSSRFSHFPVSAARVRLTTGTIKAISIIVFPITLQFSAQRSEWKSDPEKWIIYRAPHMVYASVVERKNKLVDDSKKWRRESVLKENKGNIANGKIALRMYTENMSKVSQEGFSLPERSKPPPERDKNTLSRLGVVCTSLISSVVIIFHINRYLFYTPFFQIEFFEKVFNHFILLILKFCLRISKGRCSENKI